MAGASVGLVVDDLGRAVAAFTAQLRQAPAGDPKVPHLEWTVGDTAAHILSSQLLYVDLLDGGPPVWDDIGNGVANNARNLATVTERDLAVLADVIDENAARVSARVLEEAPGTRIEAWGGAVVPVESLVCVWYADVLIHGWDIAQALDQKWEMPSDLAGRAAAGLMDTAPHFVDTEAAAGLHISYGLHIRGHFERTLEFDDGTLTVHDSVERVDCHISADPAAFLLVGYGRIGQWGAIARGKLLAYGRKPWLGFKFSKLLRNP